MYPEERLGMEINSASMMWEDVEEIFSRIRGCMSAGRQGTSSATFTMPILETVFAFWRVREQMAINLMAVVPLTCSLMVGDDRIA
jgi:hypothetical protein